MTARLGFRVSRWLFISLQWCFVCCLLFAGLLRVLWANTEWGRLDGQLQEDPVCGLRISVWST